MKSGGNSETVKNQNMESVKEILYKHEPISRSEIAKILGLTPPTITSSISELMQRGLVRECLVGDAVEASGQKRPLGRRRILLEWVPDAAYAVGVESGPSGTLACLTDLRGNIVSTVDWAEANPNYDEAMDTLARAIEEVIEKAGVARNRIAGVGVGLPGFVDREEGVLRYGALYKWQNKPVAEEIKKRVRLECHVENNTRCRALGELLFSGKRRPETFAYFLISRGMACPLMLQSQLHAGSMAGAGEIGHMVVDRFGPVCPTCGNRGCLEALSSETAIVNRCAKLLTQNTPTLLRDICRDPAAPRISEVLKAQQCGDPMVQTILEEAITYAGIAIANIINFINPPLVLVDAYIMQEQSNQELFLKIVQQNLFALNSTEVNIEFLPFEKLRAAKGAAALVIKACVLQEGRYHE